MERQACTASAITFKEPHPVSPLMYLLFPLLGLVAGILAGLLGVGGGLVLVAALAWLLPLFGVPPEVAMHAALASSLASIVLTAASSARAHARRGSVLWPTVAWMVPGLLLGAWLRRPCAGSSPATACWPPGRPASAAAARRPTAARCRRHAAGR